MNRKRRTTILVKAGASLAKEMAREVTEHYDVKEIVAPRNGLTMLKVRETAKQSLFYLGEVLMTETMVEIEGSLGKGMVIGLEEEWSRDLAIIDAAYGAKLPIIARWNQFLQAKEEAIINQENKEQAQLMETKVSFETMSI
ncbi:MULTISPECIES: phosphonate C-P lyase system protein PhnG [Cytobacillus]|uniref:Phosphonate C-P lyase system protein PhnG n=1 Tax=Cytobacillus kochii TaxID=859143 RepID=A0A248TIC4_9BACI|nr:phosphonate C-P lyase system protein PhnG [Cytobacillus kochii]ASV67879.1 phosphonate C-P lyase system protein PhnG [Cytobacillus kochii]